MHRGISILHTAGWVKIYTFVLHIYTHGAVFAGSYGDIISWDWSMSNFRGDHSMKVWSKIIYTSQIQQITFHKFTIHKSQIPNSQIPNSQIHKFQTCWDSSMSNFCEDRSIKVWLKTVYYSQIQQITFHKFKIHKFKIHKIKIQKFKTHKFKIHKIKIHRIKIHQFKNHKFKTHKIKIHTIKIHKFKIHKFKI